MNAAHYGACLACLACLASHTPLKGERDATTPLEPTLRSLVWLAGLVTGIRLAEIGVGPEGTLCAAHREAFAEMMKMIQPDPKAAMVTP